MTPEHSGANCHSHEPIFNIGFPKHEIAYYPDSSGPKRHIPLKLVEGQSDQHYLMEERIVPGVPVVADESLLSGGWEYRTWVAYPAKPTELGEITHAHLFLPENYSPATQSLIRHHYEQLDSVPEQQVTYSSSEFIADLEQFRSAWLLSSEDGLVLINSQLGEEWLFSIQAREIFFHQGPSAPSNSELIEYNTRFAKSQYRVYDNAAHYHAVLPAKAYLNPVTKRLYDISHILDARVDLNLVANGPEAVLTALMRRDISINEVLTWINLKHSLHLRLLADLSGFDLDYV